MTEAFAASIEYLNANALSDDEATTRLYEIIEAIPSHDRAGKLLLKNKLEKEGADALIKFVHDSAVTLDKYRTLDLEKDFSKEDQRFLKLTRPGLGGLGKIGRGQFIKIAFGIFAAGHSGATYALEGTTNIADKALNGEPEEKKQPVEPKAYPIVHKIKEFVHDYLADAALVTVGGLLVYEGYEHYLKTNMEQVAKAITTIQAEHTAQADQTQRT